jgi:hypothetical protein
MTLKVYLNIWFSLSCGVLAWCQSTTTVYDPTRVHTLKLRFETKDWDAKLDSIYRTFADERLSADLNYDGTTLGNVGVRYKGNSSYHSYRKRGLAKLPLNIKLPKGRFLDNKFSTLKLSNINFDASFVREAVAYDMVRAYLPAPQTAFVRVYANDKPLGLYMSVEAIDGQFLKNYYPKTDKLRYLVECDLAKDVDKLPANCPKSDYSSLQYLGEDSACYAKNYDLPKDGSWAELIKLIRTLNQEPQKIEQVFYTNDALWMLALNSVMVNLDSYNGLLSHNYYLCRMPDGRFGPLMWDLNLSFGGFSTDAASAMSLEQMQQMPPLQHVDNPKRPLISKLLQVPFYRKLYLAHMRTILSDWFVEGNEKCYKKCEEYIQLIENEVKADTNSLYSFADFKRSRTATVSTEGFKIVGIEELMRPRIAFLRNHPLLNKVPQVLDGGKIAFTVKIENAQNVLLVIRNGDNQPFRFLPMLDDGNHSDTAAGDGIFGTVLDEKPQFQYYIIAEGAEASALLPARATKELLSYKKL